MNNLQRRLFRLFVEGGGDLTNDAALEAMGRAVQTTITLMPPGTRAAMELAIGADESASYRELAAALSVRSGSSVSVQAFRQRVARGMQDLHRMMESLPRNAPEGRAVMRPE